MSSYIDEALIVTAPRTNEVAAFAVTTSSGRTNLAAIDALIVTGRPKLEQGHYLTLIADADMYFRMNNADAGTADSTATSGANRVFLLPAKTPMNLILDEGFTWMVHIAPANTTCRAYVSSKKLTQMGASHA